MYTDPWDLKHSIEQMQQEEERQKKGLLPGDQKYSSSTYHEQLSEDINHTNSNYELSEDQQQDQKNSDQNTTQKTNNQSYVKPLSDSFQPGYDAEFVQDDRNQKSRKKYGNLIVCLETKNTFLSLGPNYLFFFVAYLCFTISAIYLVHLVNTSVESINFKMFNFAFCALQNISYLLVAFSNPGVKLPNADIMMSPHQSQQRLCKTCGALQQRKTYHCRACDVCVTGYDHHCPWTSKCIGAGNLKRFYFFVCMTPFYIFYYVVAFMICMASLAIPHTKNIKPVIPPSVL